MRMRILAVLALVVLAASATRADTLHLKNGSLLKGKVTSFSDDQFVVMLDTGSGRFLSKATVHVGDVARIEFDSTPVVSLESATPREDSTSAQPTESSPLNSPKDQTSRATGDVEPRSDPPVESSSKSTASVDPPREKPAELEPSEPEPEPEKPAEKPTTNAATDIAAATAPSEVERAPRRLTGPVRSVSIDVVAKRDWTSTGLIVKRGDRIHISATGTVTLDPISGRASGAEGLADLADSKKLMADQATGALIGVIGADNDDFIFIGRSAEFTATRDGLLFLSVNEGNLSDNTGTFKAAIEVQAQRR